MTSRPSDDLPRLDPATGCPTIWRAGGRTSLAGDGRWYVATWNFGGHPSWANFRDAIAYLDDYLRIYPDPASGWPVGEADGAGAS